MLITTLELVNFKSYGQETITFRPSTTAIVGPNGAGKSSILEAIGYVLFNQRGAGHASRLREGTESGSVTVGFVSSYDERTYEVERNFSEKTTTRYRVYDVELGRQILAEGVEQVQTWLREHLRVDPTAQLDTLFESTVGVPQGTFTAPFLLPAGQRKPIFDPLLQVEDYRKASDNLLATGRHLENELADLREHTARMEERLLALPGLLAEQNTLAHTIAELASQSVQLEEQLVASQNALTALDEAEARAREAAAAFERADAQLNTQERVLAGALTQLEESNEARIQVKASRAGYEAYLEAEASYGALNAERVQRDTLLQNRAGLEQSLVRYAERRERLGKELQQIARAAERVTELKPLVAEQELLEAELRQAEQDTARLHAAERQHTAARTELERAQKALRSAENGLQEAASVEATVRDIQAHLEVLATRISQNREERAALVAEIERLHKQSEHLRDAIAAHCPVCEAELTSEHRDDLLHRNEQSIDSLKAKERRLHQLIKADGIEEGRQLDTRAQAQGRLRRLPSEEVVRRARDEEENRRGELAAVEREMSELQDAPDRAATHRVALEALGDPRRTYQLQESLASTQPAIEAERASACQQYTELEEQHAQIEQELGAYAGLDDALTEAQRAQGTHRDAHLTYLAYQRAAEQYEALSRRVVELEEGLAALQTRLVGLRQARDQSLAAYDPSHHTRTRQQVTSLRSDLATTKAQLDNHQERLQTVDDGVERLEATQIELAQYMDKRREAEELSRILEMVRRLLRQAAPHVTRQIVGQISREASALYCDIMDDHTGRLEWSEDYELALEVKGRKRAFRQFSGGEQMSAALSLRLALLRGISAIDVAFFDEPTANLDVERRDGLAAKIMQVKGFSQVFVISHDDTFERAAQSYVRIVKDKDGSRWDRE